MFGSAVMLTGAAIPAYCQSPFTTALMKSYGEMKQNLLDSSELMPDEAYSYRLTPGQQSFAEWMGHVAIANFYWCGRLGGAPPPDNAMIRSMRGKTTKPEAKKFIEESFRYCDAAVGGMDDQKAATAIPFGNDKVIPATFLVGLLTGLNEHYGNIVGYLRTRGITPPSTAREAKSK